MNSEYDNMIIEIKILMRYKRLYLYKIIYMYLITEEKYNLVMLTMWYLFGIGIYLCKWLWSYVSYLETEEKILDGTLLTIYTQL